MKNIETNLKRFKKLHHIINSEVSAAKAFILSGNPTRSLWSCIPNRIEYRYDQF